MSWFLAFEILSGRYRGIYGAIYKSPRENTSQFLCFFDEFCNSIIKPNKTNIIIGDFNINMFHDNNITKELIRIGKHYKLSQIVHAPTRECNLSSTIIDLLFTNSNKIKCEIDNINTISDHNFIKIMSTRENSNANNISVSNIKEFVSWSNYSTEKLVDLLFHCDWRKFNNLSNVTDKANCLVNFLKESVQQLTTKKIINCEKNQPWYTSDLKKMKQVMIESKLNYNNQKSDENWKIFVKQRNKYKNSLRKNSNDYVKNKLNENRKDTKKIWNLLNDLCKNKPKIIKSVSFNTVLEENELEIAEKFNDYFIDSIKVINNSIPINANGINYLNYICPVMEKLHFSVINISDVPWYSVGGWINQRKHKI